jgi:hypothetical protein
LQRDRVGGFERETSWLRELVKTQQSYRLAGYIWRAVDDEGESEGEGEVIDMVGQKVTWHRGGIAIDVAFAA